MRYLTEWGMIKINELVEVKKEHKYKLGEY